MSGAPFAWLAAACAAAGQPPARPREPLSFGGVAIGSIEGDVAARMAAEGLPLVRRDGGWHLVAHADADAAFQRIASWLRDAGLAGRWRDEKLTVDDANGRRVGAIERAAARALGIATQAVHLVGTTPAGRVWVQQRAFDKATDPGQWDTLMGGQIGDGESVAAALERETWEEAGLRVGELLALAEAGPIDVRRSVDDGYENERISVWHVVVPEPLAPANRDGEVVAFACLSADELVTRLAAGAFTLEATLILGRWLEEASGQARLK